MEQVDDVGERGPKGGRAIGLEHHCPVTPYSLYYCDASSLSLLNFLMVSHKALA
jgi:hypothetical protein